MESNGISYADVAAMVKSGDCGNQNQWNNPMWLLWALLFGFGGGGVGFGARGAGQGLQDAEIMGQLNAIRQTMADNQNATALGSGIAGNHEMLHGLGAAINAASTANLLSQKDSSAQMASCCCDIKSSILGQTNALQSQIAQLANGVQTGFANIGFLTQQQTTELNAAATANTQRILDKMCADTTQSLRDKLMEASQSAQTATILAAIPKA